MINFISPYRTDKNLGKAYNEAMSIIPDGDWACITDYDVLALTSDFGRILEEYTKKYPYAGILTCFTNRIGDPQQQLNGIDDNDSILHHIKIAERQKENLFDVTELHAPISGFLMLIKKETWNSINFSETGKCLGVDNDFSIRVYNAGLGIYRMNSVYVWHTYRLSNGIKDKNHLIP